MAVVGSQAFAVRTEPRADDLVLGAGEEEVAVGVVFDLCEGAFLEYEGSVQSVEGEVLSIRG